MTGVNTPLVSTATRAGEEAFGLSYPQASCQTRAGFTLIELLVVISILGILSSALVVSVQSGYKQARQANCKSNLRQFGVALTIYRGEHDNQTPDWISNLYPDYVDDRAMYVCRADKNNGADTPRPKELVDSITGFRNDTDTASYWDNEQNGDQKRNNEQGVNGPVKCCSYLFEFSAAETSWRVPDAARGGSPNPAQPYTMRDYKMDQMTYGDTQVNGVYIPYSASRIPIIRCYHHWKDQRVYGRNSAAPGPVSKQRLVINVAYAGNVFAGPPSWEGTLYPGETTR